MQLYCSTIPRNNNAGFDQVVNKAKQLLAPKGYCTVSGLGPSRCEHHFLIHTATRNYLPKDDIRSTVKMMAKLYKRGWRERLSDIHIRLRGKIRCHVTKMAEPASANHFPTIFQFWAYCVSSLVLVFVYSVAQQFRAATDGINADIPSYES